MGNFLKLKNFLAKLFNENGIDLSDLDWILVDVLKINRSELKQNRVLTIKQIKEIFRLAKKRLKGIPLSQVIGYVDFYGLKFFVSSNVLSPRPETELLVEEIIKDFNKGEGLDIGTGSGAIAITLNKVGSLNMTAVDISRKALKMAKKNNKSLNAKVQLKKSDLFKNIKDKKFDFIVSNPPYIKTSEINQLDKEVKNHEPHLALDGGESGLEFYKKIIEDAPKYLKDNAKIYFELGIGQHKDVEDMLKKDFKDIEIIKDYCKIERIIKATKK